MCGAKHRTELVPVSDYRVLPRTKIIGRVSYVRSKASDGAGARL